MGWLAAAAGAVPTAGPDLDALFGAGGGAALLALIYWVIRLVLDKRVPTQSDSRADKELVSNTLTNMVKVLTEEKKADADRLATKQARIDELEKNADEDYDRLQDLRREIVELGERLAQKDRVIRILVTELRKLGAVVTGVIADPETGDIEITHTPEEVREARKKHQESQEENYS